MRDVVLCFGRRALLRTLCFASASCWVLCFDDVVLCFARRRTSCCASKTRSAFRSRSGLLCVTVQFPASPTLIGSVEGPTKQARGDAPDDPAPSCPAEGSDSGAGGPPGGPKPASQEAAGPPPHCAAPGVATLRGAQGAGPGAARGKVPRGGAPFSPHLVGNSLLTRCDPK